MAAAVNDREFLPGSERTETCSPSNTASTFASSLGQFADPHIDNHDAGAALTAMTLHSSIPANYSPGIFAYHDFKVFIKPPELSIVYFTGLHRHGGTAPSPPPGEQAVPWAYRLAIICYPNESTMLGESRNPLVPFRGFDFVKKNLKPENNDRSDVLKIPPEVRNRERYLIVPALIVRIKSDHHLQTGLRPSEPRP